MRQFVLVRADQSIVNIYCIYTVKHRIEAGSLLQAGSQGEEIICCLATDDFLSLGPSL